MNQDNLHFLKYIGYLQNLLKMVETIQNQITYLLIGVSSGVPLNIISFRVTVYFFLSFIFEIPTGVLADVIGKTLSIAIGYWFMALSALLVFASLLSGYDTFWCYILVGLSAITGAVASGLIIATLNTFLQKKIDEFYLKHKAELSPNFKIKALSMSQGHGNGLGTIVPCIVLGLCIVLLRYSNIAKYMLLIPVLINFFVGCYFYQQHQLLLKLENRVPFLNQIRLSYCSYSSNIKHFYLAVRYNTLVCSTVIPLLALAMICTLLMIHVHTYMMVAQLRLSDIYHSDALHLLLLVFIATAFDQATYMKGIIVPFVSKKIKPDALIVISFVLILALSVATLGIYNLMPVVAIYFFALFFRPFLSIGQFIINSTLMHAVPSEIRTTILSISQAGVILLYSMYSLYLSTTQAGLDTPIANIIEVIAVVCFGLIIFLISKNKLKQFAI